MTGHEKPKLPELVDLSDIHSVIKDIKGGIQVCMDGKYGGSLLKLIYSGIDTMAYLTIPIGTTSKRVGRLQKVHFKQWVDKYLRFLHPRCKSEYIWEARNGLLHTHGAESVAVLQGKVPRIYYYARNYPPTKQAMSDGEHLIFLSLPTLIREFFKGIDQYVIDLYSDEEKRVVAEKRCGTMLQVYDDFDKFEREGTIL
ncbi:MAG: hypothetical protein OXG23_13725 [Chloroflexi bacterium]|nr:hypothetical protein [Chloroflexota bacterium]